MKEIVKMKLEFENNKVIMRGIEDFDPKHIFDCGQCFRWNENEDGSFTGVARERVVRVSKKDGAVTIENADEKDFNEIWMDYFDLKTDYSKIKEVLEEQDVYLKNSVEFGYGIRILKQELFEIMISFIISANNRIPMIKKAIGNLSKEYGEKIGDFDGMEHYSFPKAEVLAAASEEDIKSCKTGFRAKYIKRACEMVASKELDLESIIEMNDDDARKELLKVPGIGPKVADCIMLFGLSRPRSFPVDVWVKRVMEEFYVEEGMSLKKIGDYAFDKFGDLAGYAQQYLFYYAREKGIGK